MEEKEYKNKVMFLRLSKKGEHLYSFGRKGILAEDLDSIVMNVSDMKALLSGGVTWIKVSAMKKEVRDGGDLEQEELDGEQM